MKKKGKKKMCFCVVFKKPPYKIYTYTYIYIYEYIITVYIYNTKKK